MKTFPWHEMQNIKNVPGGAVNKNPPANAGDTGSIPGPGRFHSRKIPHACGAAKPMSHNY